MGIKDSYQFSESKIRALLKFEHTSLIDVVAAYRFPWGTLKLIEDDLK